MQIADLVLILMRELLAVIMLVLLLNILILRDIKLRSQMPQIMAALGIGALKLLVEQLGLARSRLQQELVLRL